MDWGGQHGQIIGMKERERQLVAKQRELEIRVREVLTTINRSRRHQKNLDSLLSWAADQLDHALAGRDVVPFAPHGGSNQT